jgi:PAS domain S-box-containing protein
MEEWLTRAELFLSKFHVNFWLELTAVIAAIAIFWGQLKVMVKGFCKMLWVILMKPKEIVDFFTNLTKAMRTVELISKEFKNNGGSSMRDAIDFLKKDLKEIRRDMAISRQRIRTSYDVQNIGFFETDLEGKCLYVSKKWCDLSGISSKDAMGHGWRNAISEHDRQRVIEEFCHSVQDKRDFDTTYEIVNRDGKLTRVHGHATPVYGHDDEIVAFIGTIKIVAENY